MGDSSGRQWLASQGAITGAVSLLTSLSIAVTGTLVVYQARDILHFTSLIIIACLEIVSGFASAIVGSYIWWRIGGRGTVGERLGLEMFALAVPLLLTYSSMVVSIVLLVIKGKTTSRIELQNSINLYQTRSEHKQLIDRIQIIFRCCGSVALSDWFMIDWQGTDVQPSHAMNSNTSQDWDSVPFSCCCIEASSPCNHQRLQIFGVDTLHQKGCADHLDSAVVRFLFAALFMFFVSAACLSFTFYISRQLVKEMRGNKIRPLTSKKSNDGGAGGSFQAGKSTTEAAKPADKSKVKKVKASSGKTKKSKYSLWYTYNTGDHLQPHELYENDREPLLGKPDVRRSSSDVTDLCSKVCKPRSVFCYPTMAHYRSKFIDSNIDNEDWEGYNLGSVKPEVDSSEEWPTKVSNDPPSMSSSSSSFVTTSLSVDPRGDSRRSFSDTAVASLEVSHHFEHKIRPLYRT